MQILVKTCTVAIIELRKHTCEHGAPSDGLRDICRQAGADRHVQRGASAALERGHVPAVELNVNGEASGACCSEGELDNTCMTVHMLLTCSLL
jgi:hypothetical protein